jgi:uncharacterized protein DUF3558
MKSGAVIWDGSSDLMVGMRTTRVVAVGALAVAGLLLAGCGGSGGGEAASPTTGQPSGPSPLASFDPCTVLSQQELQAFGVTEPGEVFDQGIGEPGCEFNAGGGDYLLTIYKAEGSDRAYWEQRRDNFGLFEENQVGSHAGIAAIEKGAMGHGGCRQIMESGGGSVSVDIQLSADKKQGNDPCAKALEIARVVEPKLPK